MSPDSCSGRGPSPQRANEQGTYWTPYEQLDFQDVTAVNDTACLVAGAGTVPGFWGQSIVASFHSSGDTSWARVIDWSIYSDLLTAAVMENSTTALVAGRLGGLNSDWSKVYRIDLGTGTVTGSNGFSGAPYSWAQRMDRGSGRQHPAHQPWRCHVQPDRPFRRGLERFVGE